MKESELTGVEGDVTLDRRGKQIMKASSFQMKDRSEPYVTTITTPVWLD